MASLRGERSECDRHDWRRLYVLPTP